MCFTCLVHVISYSPGVPPLSVLYVEKSWASQQGLPGFYVDFRKSRTNDKERKSEQRDIPFFPPTLSYPIKETIDKLRNMFSQNYYNPAGATHAAARFVYLVVVLLANCSLIQLHALLTLLAATLPPAVQPLKKTARVATALPDTVVVTYANVAPEVAVV